MQKWCCALNYIGWLGHQNVGDEALYCVSKTYFPSFNLIPDLYSQHSRITLFGGGTVLPFFMLHVRPNHYNYAFGVGVANPSFWGNFDPLLIDRLKSFNFRLLTVRGVLSQQVLKSWGISSEVIGDPCLLLEPRVYKQKDPKLIAINIGTSKGVVWGSNELIIRNEAVSFCKILKKNGYNPILVPFCAEDEKFIRDISQESNVPVFGKWRNLSDLLALLSSCRITIGQKLHSLVLSAAAYTPFISIEYRPKCHDFAKTMGFENFNIKTNVLDANRLFLLMGDLLENWREMNKILIENVEKYRSKLKVTAESIISDINALPASKWSSSGVLTNNFTKYSYKLNSSLYYRSKYIWRVYSNSLFKNT